MTLLHDLVAPLSLDAFREEILFHRPYARPGRARRFYRLVSWELLEEIFATGHPDCWLPRRGRLPDDPALATGVLTLEQARGGFLEGRTILVRHAERAHPKIEEVAADFRAHFGRPVDVQLYCTPAGEEGFDWHFDVEDVFVIQCSGVKEFRLRKPRDGARPASPPAPSPTRTAAGHRVDLGALTEGPEITCVLQAGDWLYVPAGYWHKARAATPSFHLSVGVLFETH